MSARAIAAELGVSPDTVDRARRAAARDQAPERVIGKDGKSYPVHLKSKKGALRKSMAEVATAGSLHHAFCVLSNGLIFSPTRSGQRIKIRSSIRSR